MAAVQVAELRLQPVERAQRGFFGWFEENHKPATSSGDLTFVDLALDLPEALPRWSGQVNEATIPSASLFSSAPLLD
jgi:hypothetical protein